MRVHRSSEEKTISLSLKENQQVSFDKIMGKKEIKGAGAGAGTGKADTQRQQKEAVVRR